MNVIKRQSIAAQMEQLGIADGKDVTRPMEQAQLKTETFV